MAMQKKYQFSTENVRIVASWKANIPKLLQQNVLGVMRNVLIR